MTEIIGILLAIIGILLTILDTLTKFLYNRNKKIKALGKNHHH